TLLPPTYRPPWTLVAINSSSAAANLFVATTDVLSSLIFVSDPHPWMLLNTGFATADLFTLQQLSMLYRHQPSSITRTVLF
ncbi:hypothetical protein PanWU01x14_304080, partial [Parasponia andersonii]